MVTQRKERVNADDTAFVYGGVVFASVDARTVEEKQGMTCNSPACAARLRNTGVFWNKKNDAHR